MNRLAHAEHAFFQRERDDTGADCTSRVATGHALIFTARRKTGSVPGRAGRGGGGEGAYLLNPADAD